MMKKIWPLATAAAALCGGALLVKKHQRKNRMNAETKKEELLLNRDYGDQQIFLIGEDLYQYAASVYLIRDGHFPGENIHFFPMRPPQEKITAAGGCEASNGWRLHEIYGPLFYDLFESIPSLRWSGHSVTEEIANFQRFHPIYAQSRLIDKNERIIDGHLWELKTEERLKLFKLLQVPNEQLVGLTLEDWFNPHFFETTFWNLWQSTFLLKPWSALSTLKEQLVQYEMKPASLITMAGMSAPPLDPAESLLQPLKHFLTMRQVHFHDTGIKDWQLSSAGDRICGLRSETGELIRVGEQDAVLFRNADSSAGAQAGTRNAPPDPVAAADSELHLWQLLAEKTDGAGTPARFFRDATETGGLFFTFTCKEGELLKRLVDSAGNVPGSGGLSTLVDSSWLITTCLPAQPLYEEQTAGTFVLYGYGQSPMRIGDYCRKPMLAASGEELFEEWISQLGWEAELEVFRKELIDAVPVFLPYQTSAFIPASTGSLPSYYDSAITNLAFVSIFAESAPGKTAYSTEERLRVLREIVEYVLALPGEVPQSESRLSRAKHVLRLLVH